VGAFATPTEKGIESCQRGDGPPFAAPSAAKSGVSYFILLTRSWSMKRLGVYEPVNYLPVGILSIPLLIVSQTCPLFTKASILSPVVE